MHPHQYSVEEADTFFQQLAMLLLRSPGCSKQLWADCGIMFCVLYTIVPFLGSHAQACTAVWVYSIPRAEAFYLPWLNSIRLLSITSRSHSFSLTFTNSVASQNADLS